MKKFEILRLWLVFIIKANAQVTPTSGEHPKLVKTKGTGPGPNVGCSLKDKTRKLWFGTGNVYY